MHHFNAPFLISTSGCLIYWLCSFAKTVYYAFAVAPLSRACLTWDNFGGFLFFYSQKTTRASRLLKTKAAMPAVV
jgi:hypothetical protein